MELPPYTNKWVTYIFCLFYLASEPESEEDKGKKDVREKMKQEYYFAIQEEGEWLWQKMCCSMRTMYLLVLWEQ